MLLAAIVALAQQDKPLVVSIDRDDVEITQSCTVDPAVAFVVDANGDGVVHIVGDDLVVTFTRAPLVGCAPKTEPDAYSGIGITVKGKNVTIRGALLGGFKAGIVARGCDGLVLDGCSFSDMFRQRLKSTPEHEDESDWLWPHKNDADEWLTNYGACVYVTESKGVTLRNNTARAGQNGICLRRVEESQVYDNDMSFMSGWGLALYRSSKNVVSRNSFDFCIRGYSDGVYARGQDSAGILCFEQSSDNVFAFNSATHGGDGFFGFAGNEALEGDVPDHKGLGCNRNVLYGNDFSYAAAIGIEMTFSFENVFAKNKLASSNYGIWGGYSQATSVVDNEIVDNSISGLAVEHGSRWRITKNLFSHNARAIELWWDDDAELMSKPWAKANGGDSKNNRFIDNSFVEQPRAFELRGGAAASTDLNVDLMGSAENDKLDEKSRLVWNPDPVAVQLPSDEQIKSWPGKSEAVGALKNLEGRDKIIVTEWGPYDWRAPFLQRIENRGNAHAWRLLGEEMPIGVDAGREVKTKLDVSVSPAVITVAPRKPNTVTSYELVVQVPSKAKLTSQAVLVDCEWKIGVFAYTADPREKLDEWHAQSKAAKYFTAPRLKLAYGNEGPSELKDAPKEIVDAKLPKDHFGTLASTKLALPAGRWRITSNSDDGVRVWIDDEPVIDNWTWHVPTLNTFEFESAGAETSIRVEHFELDGYSVLELALEPVK